MNHEFTLALSTQVLAEFNGYNHLEIAIRHKISVVTVYRIIQQERLAGISEVLQITSDNGGAVLLAKMVTQLDFLGGLQAVLQAVKKAEDMDAIHRAVIAIAILPEGNPGCLDDGSFEYSLTVPTKIQPNTPAPDDTAPAPEAATQSAALSVSEPASFTPNNMNQTITNEFGFSANANILAKEVDAFIAANTRSNGKRLVTPARALEIVRMSQPDYAIPATSEAPAGFPHSLDKADLLINPIDLQSAEQPLAETPLSMHQQSN